MVPTRARRRALAGAALAVLVLAGCGADPAPAADLRPAVTPTEGSAEVEVCAALKSTVDVLFAAIFWGEVDPPTPESTADLRDTLTDYAERIRLEAPGTTDPVLRPALEAAASEAEAASGVASVAELRETGFKAAGLEADRVCREIRNRAAETADEPDALAASTELGAACDLPVTFRIFAGWAPAPATDDPDGALFDDDAVGPFRKQCDIVASPVSRLGSLTVATAPASAGDPRASLVPYLREAVASEAYDVHRPTYTSLREVRGLPAGEAGFLMEGGGRTVRVKVFVVAVPDGLVLVRANAPDGDPGPSIWSGYELAQQTLRAD